MKSINNFIIEKLNLSKASTQYNNAISYEDYYDEHIGGGEIYRFGDLDIFSFNTRLKKYRKFDMYHADEIIYKYFNNNDTVYVTKLHNVGGNRLVGKYCKENAIKDEFMNTRYKHQLVNLNQGAYVIYELTKSNMVLLIKKTFGSKSMVMPLEVQYIWKTLNENVI